jgi:hypothetical protein
MNEELLKEHPVYSPWAFSENEHDKCIVNEETYKWLKENYKITNQFHINYQKLNPDDFDIIINSAGKGYAYNLYEIIKNIPQLPISYLALLCDDGNLCFGYSIRSGNICIHTD